MIFRELHRLFCRFVSHVSQDRNGRRSLACNGVEGFVFLRLQRAMCSRYRRTTHRRGRGLTVVRNPFRCIPFLFRYLASFLRYREDSFTRFLLSFCCRFVPFVRTIRRHSAHHHRLTTHRRTLQYLSVHAFRPRRMIIIFIRLGRVNQGCTHLTFVNVLRPSFYRRTKGRSHVFYLGASVCLVQP